MYTYIKIDQIFINIPQLPDAKGICASEFSIWWAALTMYWFLMMDNVPNLIQSFILVIFTRWRSPYLLIALACNDMSSWNGGSVDSSFYRRKNIYMLPHTFSFD